MKAKLKIPDKHKERLYPAVLGLFSDKDFHQVNMRAISRRSGVSIGTIYRYFSSKEDLLFSILAEKIEAIGALVGAHVQGLGSFKEIFRKVMWITMNYYDQNPGVAITAFITVPIRTWMQQPGYRMEKQVFADLVAQGRFLGGLDETIDLRRFQDIYYMICYRCIHSWYFFGRKWKLVDAVARDFDLWWKLLAPPRRGQGD
ncbi:MAG: TetR/AcrR family transcriptional regulator [Thermodesulfobacteriota bacterium]